MNAAQFSDEDLTAFLDGEADAELNEAITTALETDAQLNARLSAIDIPVAAIRQGFDALLSEAPTMPEEDAARPAPTRLWPVALGTFATGLVAGFAIAMFTPTSAPVPAAPGWKAVVASYQSLYSAETLWGGTPDADTQRAQLARVSEAIGVDLSDLPAPSGLTFKRAQLLSFKGRPLAQLAYQREDGTPVALCILQVASNEAKPLAMETLQGIGAASWNAGGYGYLLIGGNETDALETQAIPFQRWSQAAT